MDTARVHWALEQARITKEMDIEGTTEYNVLHIPRRARQRFIEIIECSHPSSSVEFWKSNWKKRDENAKNLIGFERAEFLSKCCHDEEEILSWEEMWKTIDRSILLKSLIANSKQHNY